jgi:hypothetical protein
MSEARDRAQRGLVADRDGRVPLGNQMEDS